MILASLKGQDIILMIDTSKVGGNCICLMLSVYYNGRALPLCWSVYKGRKGHSSCQLQLSLLDYITKHIDKDTNIILLGDGEFDSTDLIKWLIKKPNWQYVCRTAKNIHVFYEQSWVSLSELPLITGEDAFFTEVLFTKSAKIEHVNIAALWNEEDECHWFMVTDMKSIEEAQQWYRFRFTIETLFSDLKGRGFNIDKTRLYHPERVSRLMLTTVIAYLFSIFLGTEAILNGAVAFLACAADSIVDTYYSLFKIGLMYLDHLLNECETFPRWLRIPSPDEFYHGSASPIYNY